MYNSMATATYNPPAAMYPMMPMYGGYGDGSYEYSTGAYLQ
jgi:hypothetical protein